MPSAFDARRNPGGVRLGALFGSDIGHWDVPLMEDVLGEVYEPVEKDGLPTGQSDLRRLRVRQTPFACGPRRT